MFHIVFLTSSRDIISRGAIIQIAALFTRIQTDQCSFSIISTTFVIVLLSVTSSSKIVQSAFSNSFIESRFLAVA